MDQIELALIAEERKTKLERIDQLMTEIVRVGREITMRTSRNAELANQAKGLDIPDSPKPIRERLQDARKELNHIKRTGKVVHHKLQGIVEGEVTTADLEHGERDVRIDRILDQAITTLEMEQALAEQLVKQLDVITDELSSVIAAHKK